MVAAVLAVAIVGPWLGIHQLNAAAATNGLIAEARDELDGLVRTQLAEETGLRGYVETGDGYFLESDGPPNPSFAPRVAHLADLVQAVHVDGAAFVDDIRSVHEQWRNRGGAARDDRRRRDAAALETPGKLLTDRLRACLRRPQRAAQRRRRRRRAGRSHHLRRSP